MDKRRVMLAFVVAPLAVPLVFSLPALLPSHGDYLTTLFLMLVYGLPIAYLFEILLGVPALILFVRYHVKSPFAFALGGIVIGLLVDVVVKMPSKTLHEWSPGDMLYSLAAAGSALLFRVIAFGIATAQNA